MKKYWADCLCIGFLCLALPLFFFKLGQSSLVSWDEAWYGVIARNMLLKHNYLLMWFNALHFTDHPPGGIWPIAISYKFLGITEFATRLPSAIAGFLSLLVTYLLGRKLFNRVVGFTSAVALCSAPWFLLRSRLGDLDTPLVLFFLLTMLLALYAANKRKYFLWFALSLGYLTTIKAALPFAVMPSLVVIFWGTPRFKFKYLFLAACSIMVFYVSWLLLMKQIDLASYRWHLSHLTRGAGLAKPDYVGEITKFKAFLHNGIGKWFWPGLISLVGGLLLKQRRYVILFTFFISYSLPLLSSPNLEIWHLIPLYPIMILAAFGFFWEMGQTFLPSKILAALALGVCVYFSYPQIMRLWQQNIHINPYVSDEAILAKAAGQYSYPLTIDFNFLPAALFYSQKLTANQYSGTDLTNFFSGPGQQMLITYQWRLDAVKNQTNAYEVLARDRDKVLILKTKM